MVALSIIIPVYNVEKYVSKCIESILDYPRNDIEVIAVIDGSTDNSKGIIEEYAIKDKRLKVIYQNNKGVSSARNNGIHNAMGKYIMFVDADDWIEPKVLLKIIDKLNDDEGDLILVDYKNVDKKKVLNVELNLSKDVQNYQIYELLISGSKMNYCWGKIYSTEILRKYNILFRENIKVGEDVIFVIDYIEKSQVIKYFNELLYNYRQNGEGVMTKISLTKFYDMKHSFERRLRFCKKHKLDLLMEKMIIYYRKAIFIYLKQIQTSSISLCKKIQMIMEITSIDVIRQICVASNIANGIMWQACICQCIKYRFALGIWFILRKHTINEIKQK